MKKVNVFSRLVMVFSFCVMSMTFSVIQASAETNECTASFDFQSNTLHVPCFNWDNNALWLDLGLISADPLQFQLSNYGATGGAACLDDDVQNGIYRICNYFPLTKGNYWRYTTGNYSIMNETRTCSSGYSGVRYGTTSYGYDEPFIAVNEQGFMSAGCQYDDEGVLKDLGTPLIFIKPEMQIGETVSTSIPPGIINQNGTTIDTTFVDIESITVPAGTFNTSKFDILVNDIGECSYKTTLWFGKGVGPVKIHRTNANPATCLGCLFVCDPNDDVTKLNTPAELVSAAIDGNAIPFDVTGTWSGTLTLNMQSGSGPFALTYVLTQTGSTITGTFAGGSSGDPASPIYSATLTGNSLTIISYPSQMPSDDCHLYSQTFTYTVSSTTLSLTSASGTMCSGNGVGGHDSLETITGGSGTLNKS